MSRLSDSFLSESIHLLDESLVKIEHCVGQLNEEQLWHRPFAAANSVANLILHIEGNLRQWSIAGIGGIADARDRESEFTITGGLSASQLLGRLSTTITETKSLLGKLKKSDLLETKKIQGFKVSALGAIVHTTTHCVGHTHQIVMLTRMILKERYEFQWSPETPPEKVPI